MTADRDRALAEFIVEQGLADAQLRDLLLSQAKETGTPFIDLLVQNGVITEDQKAEILGEMEGGGEETEEPVEPAQMAERVQDPEPAEEESEEPTPAPQAARGRSRTSPRLQAAAQRRGGFGWFRVFLVFILLGEIGAVGYLYTKGHVPLLEKLIPRQPEPEPQRLSDGLADLYRSGNLDATSETAMKAMREPPLNPEDPPDAEAFYWFGRVCFRQWLRSARFPAVEVRLGEVGFEPPFGDSEAATDRRRGALKAFHEVATNARGLRKPERMAMVIAIQRFHAGDWTGALAEFEEAARLDPDEAEAAVLAAHAEYMAMRFETGVERARAAFGGASGRDARVIFARLQHARAIKADAQGERGGEQHLLDGYGAVKGIADAPDAATALAEICLMLSDKLARRGDHAEARKYFEAASKACAGVAAEASVMISTTALREFSARRLVDTGRAGSALDEYAKAADDYATMINLGLKGPAVLERRGSVRLAQADIHLSRGAPGLALPLLKEAAADLRSAHESSGQPDAAVRALSAEAQHYRLGQTRQDLIRQSFERQIELIQQAGPPDDPQLRVELARVRLAFARWLFDREEDATQYFDRAVGDLTAVLERDERNPLAYLRRAEARVQRARHEIHHRREAAPDLDGALKDATEALRLRPDLIEAALVRSDAQLLKPDFDGAIQGYGELIKLQPEMALATARRGRAYSLKAETEAAQGGDPSSLDDLALKDLEKALSINPELFESMELRGRIWLGRAARKLRAKQDPAPEVQQVEADAGRALKINADWLPGIRLLAEAKLILAQHRSAPGQDPEADYRQAAVLFSRVIELNSRDYRALWKRGEAHMGLGEFIKARSRDPRESLKQAITDLSQAMHVRPDDPSACSDRAHAYHLQSEYNLTAGDRKKDPAALEQCVKDATRALDMDAKDVRALWDRGSSLLLLGKYKEAIVDFEQVRTLDPSKDQAAQRQIGYCRIAIQQGQ